MSLSRTHGCVFEWDLWACLGIGHMGMSVLGTYGNDFK